MDLKLKSEIEDIKQKLAADPQGAPAAESSAAHLHNHPQTDSAQPSDAVAGVWQKGPAVLGLVIVLVLGVLGSLALAWQTGSHTPTAIDSFAACQSAGNPVTQASPRQCRLPDGRVFTEPAPQTGTFAACAQAGNPIIETSPRQCRDSSGKLFIEP